jgi:hypothetical protein
MNRRATSATISSNLNDKKSSNPDRTQSRSFLPRETSDADIPRIIELAHVSMGHSGSFSGLEDFDERKSVIQPETTSKTYGSTEGHHNTVRKLFQSPPPSASISTLLSSPDSDVTSRIVIYLCVLISDMCRGVLFPTLWLLIYSLGGTKATQGIVVAAFSAGRILGSPLFGYWSEQYGFQKVLIICNAIIIIGTFLYAISGHVAMVIVSQLVIGFGAGR